MSSQLGLEISHQQIKAVMISRHKRTLRIHKTAVVDIKADASLTAQMDALNEMRQLLNYKNQATVFTMPHEDVMMKTLSLDITLTHDEIITHLTNQAPTLFGYHADEIAIDFVPLTTASNQQQHLQIVATKRNHINHIASLFRSCRFALKAIDTNAFALARTLPLLNLDMASHHCVALLALERNSSLFIVIENTRPIYTTTLDTNDDVVAFHRAQQFFQNAEPDKKIHRIVFIGPEKQPVYSRQQFAEKTGLHTSIATIDNDYLATTNFDPHLFASLGAALWK